MQGKRSQLGGGISGIEARQRARVTLAREQRAGHLRAKLARLRHVIDGNHPRRPTLDGAGERRAGAEHVDDDGRAARGPRAFEMIEQLNPHRRPRARSRRGEPAG